MTESTPPLVILNTSRRDTADVEDLVCLAVQDFYAADIVVRVKGSAKPGYRGRAYTPTLERSPTRHLPGARYLIVVRLGPDSSYPTGNVQDAWRWTRRCPSDAARPRAWTLDWFGQIKQDRRGNNIAVRWGRIVRGPMVDDMHPAIRSRIGGKCSLRSRPTSCATSSSSGSMPAAARPMRSERPSVVSLDSVSVRLVRRL